MNNSILNWPGIISMYKKETIRFLRVYHQTILTPIVNSVLYVIIFLVAMGNKDNYVAGSDLSYAEFLVPGLIAMSVIQGSLTNVLQFIVAGKILRTIVDYIIPPFNALDWIVIAVSSAVTRGVLIGLLSFIVLEMIIGVGIYSIMSLLLYLLISTVLASFLGMIIGILSNTFDDSAAWNGYIITPMIFLSCTFYSVDKLPEPWRYIVVKINPFFHIINGYRYSISGYSGYSLQYGVWLLLFFSVISFLICFSMLKSGYKIKS